MNKFRTVFFQSGPIHGIRMRLGSQYQRVYAVFLALQEKGSCFEPCSDKGLTILPSNQRRLVWNGLKVTYDVSFGVFERLIATGRVSVPAPRILMSRFDAVSSDRPLRLLTGGWNQSAHQRCGEPHLAKEFGLGEQARMT